MQDQESPLVRGTIIFERSLTVAIGTMITAGLLYLVGAVQGFTEDTQQVLLAIVQQLAAPASIASLLALLIELALAIAGRGRPGLLARLIALIVSAAIAIGLLAAGTALLVMVEPRL